MIRRTRIIRGDRGFTLVELLITVVIIAILTAISIPAYISVVASSQDSAAKQSLSSVMAAEDIYTTAAKTAGTFTDLAGLSTASLVTFTDPSKIVAASGSGCFVVAALSATGKIFYATDKNRNPTTIDPGTSCATLPPFPGIPDLSNILAFTINTAATNCGLAYTLPASGSPNITVNWGDGSAIQTVTTNNPTHNYATQGTYSLVLTGTVPAFTYTGAANNTQCTTALTKWGQGVATANANNMFYNATQLTSVVTPPNTVTAMANMFYGTSFNGSLATWNTSKVTNMGGLFQNDPAFNQPVNFDTSNVTNFSSMFSNATSFNQPVAFNTSKALYMSSMFSGATVFNQPVSFDTSQVTAMDNMFRSTSAFNQPVTFTSTANVTTMYCMFLSANVFNQYIKSWDVAAVTNSTYFRLNSALTLANSPF